MINYLYAFVNDEDYEDFVFEEDSILSTSIDEVEPDNLYDMNNNLIKYQWYIRLRHDSTKDTTLYRHFYRKWRLEKEDEYICTTEIQSGSREDIYGFEEEPGKATRPPCPPEG